MVMTLDRLERFVVKMMVFSTVAFGVTLALFAIYQVRRGVLGPCIYIARPQIDLGTLGPTYISDQRVSPPFLDLIIPGKSMMDKAAADTVKDIMSEVEVSTAPPPEPEAVKPSAEAVVESPSEETVPATTTAPAAATSPALWPYIVLVLAALLVIAGLIVLFLKRRRAVSQDELAGGERGWITERHCIEAGERYIFFLAGRLRG